MSNYDDVWQQLTSAGLQVERLEVGKLRRCKVEGEAERRGWYHLHEMRLANGDELIVGSYGVWRGNENNATKVELKKTDLTADQRDSLRRRLAEDRRQAEAARKADAARAAAQAAAAWRKCSEAGDCEYLHRKGVIGHGVRYSPSGAMAIPMLDVAGTIHGLQIIRGKTAAGGKAGSGGAEAPAARREKEYWPRGIVKKGHFHLIGMAAGAAVVLVAEGYATAASLYQATGLPVAVAFDAGNLAPVASALRARYKNAKYLICADDDKFSEGNPGVTAASAAAMEVAGAFAVPVFADPQARQAAYDSKGQKLTDYNDVHALEGLHAVRTQIEARLSELGWRVSAARAGAAPQGAGGSAKDPLRPIETLDELLERYSLIYGQGGTVFDHQEHCLLALSDMRDLCIGRYIHREWSDHPERRIARMENVGFDPAETDPDTHCNLWAGWPTTPKAGSCDYLLDLLRYMCAGDADPEGLYQWVLRWIAYPIQHPGAKMQTTLVVHGPQGTGKNMFFEAVMNIYGRYGRIIDQSAIEDKFNDWASRRLFLIADEVVARSDLYHVKNKLKAFITGEWIRINPKNMPAYDERNHVNMVFLSNESMPTIVEQDDRRHVVIWTPEKLSADYYQGLKRELDAGGSAALHDYLLHLDLGDFGPSSKPPMTDAKRELIDQSLDSPSRFVLAFERGDVEGFPAASAPALLTPCLAMDFYDLYCEYSRRNGIKALSTPKFMNAVDRKHRGRTERKRIGGSGNPVRVLHLPGGHTKPDTGAEGDWLQDRVDVFKTALKDYKNTTGVAF
jgi:putative DNA primase/helicase